MQPLLGAASHEPYLPETQVNCCLCEEFMNKSPRFAASHQLVNELKVAKDCLQRTFGLVL